MLKDQRLSAKQTEWIFLSITGILFYCLNYYSVLAYDDWFYALICEDNGFFSLDSNRTPVRTVSDIFISQCNHYQFVNGRFLLHFIVQLFVGILGLRAFQVANTIMFVILVKYLCYLCIPKQHMNRILPYLLTSLIFWIAMGFMDIGLGYYFCISFSVNYLWPSTLFVIVVYIWYNNNGQKCSIANGTGIFLMSLLCGASSESFSVGLSGALFFYYCFNLKSFTRAKYYLVAGLWIGTALLVFSPANFSRFTDANDAGFLRELLLRFFWLGSHIKLLIPIFILTIVYIAINVFNKYRFKDVIKKNSMLLNALILTFIFLFLAGFKGNPQMFISISLIIIIIIMRFIFVNERILLKNSNILSYVCIFILTAGFITILNGRNNECRNYNDTVSEYIASGFKNIEYKEHNSSFKAEEYITFISRRFLKFSVSGLAVANNVNNEPLIIPENDGTFDMYRIIKHSEEYTLRDAKWCYIMETNFPELYSFTAAKFTHKNFILKLYAKVSKEATTSLQLKSYPVIIGGKKYLIIDKGADDFIINHLIITKNIITNFNVSST